MKKMLSVLFIGFSTFSYCFAQSGDLPASGFFAEPNRYFWSSQDKKCCDKLLIDGDEYYIAKVPGYEIAVSISQFQKYVVANVHIFNRNGQRIDVRPEDARWAFWKKAEDAFKMEPVIVEMTPASQIADKIMSRQAWANALGAVGAGMQTQTATVANNQTGETATVTAPNTAAQQNARRSAETGNAKAADTASSVSASAFKANTIFPGKSNSGNIYFKKQKHQRAVFMIKIGDFEYAFLYTYPKPI